MSKKAQEPEKNKKDRLQRESKNKNKPIQKKKSMNLKKVPQTKKNWSNDFDDENYDEYYD